MSQLTLQEIHQLAMKEVGDHLEAEGFEFLAVNSQLKRTPQFVCVKEKKLFFVVVQGTVYPQAPKKFDPELIEKVKEHAVKNNAQLFLAGVGFAHAENYKYPLTKNDPYAVNFQGLEVLL
ncbi:Na(+)-translocating NADH-quinone reductase subunit F [Flavobacteriaceae bacterium]|nr:Na(+)-translocating NADH-quinone reductase subunit F [Flavobacteriaceae bacterium]MDA9571960.1 Na(+)-translocating NADH-quinone reductase subunit F [Flavobacteriaceae bacterium]